MASAATSVANTGVNTSSSNNHNSNSSNNCMLAGLSLAAGATPILLAPETAELHYGLQAKIDDRSLRWEKKAFEDDDLFRLGREAVGRVVDAVFVTSGPRDPLSEHISALCRRNRIPVNVVDAPHLCTFTLLSVHADGPLQVRRRIQDDDCLALGDLDDSLDQGALFNRLVAEEDVRNRRMRWLSQVCEYWPLRKLAAVADEDVDRLFAAYTGPGADASRKPHHDASTQRRVGKLILAGSGPGHPSLLTRSTLDAINRADLILADKLVPAPVLDLIPRRTPVHIARKFPGNAERAQEELLEAALQGVREGKTVLRLKQGDPFVYGRGGEEVDWFKGKGLGDRVRVLPGVTSALSAPLFAGVPVTQRDVADQVLICTGTGKKGKPPTPPNTTTESLPSLEALAAADADADAKRALWPLSTPCAVIERASCPDQRIIRTTLAHGLRRAPPREKGRAWLVEEGFRGLDDDWADEQAEWAAGLDAVVDARETASA
ncbi:hypothetical protein ACCO45_002069 [Purpureocillium lilacinum]|uniref:Uncharacterized protein n=1 Tax=Purpureocillium lilacinum TaxID=33203 RepID=A0ACC4E8U4_PURLI